MPPKGYKKANPKPKKVYKHKLVTLISGLEEGHSWFIGAYIIETGGFKSRGFFRTRDNRENYKKFGYKALHPEDRGWHLRLFDRNLTDNEIKKRCAFKRKRNLGFIPLNEPFKNSIGHHIDKDMVVYIPRELHKPYHCLGLNKRKTKGMLKINMKIIGFFLWKQCVSNSNV